MKSANFFVSSGYHTIIVYKKYSPSVSRGRVIILNAEGFTSIKALRNGGGFLSAVDNPIPGKAHDFGSWFLANQSHLCLGLQAAAKIAIVCQKQTGWRLFER